MQSRPGFARLLPLMMLTGLAAGTIALLASARPVHAPQKISPKRMVAARWDGGCSDVPEPVPAHGIVDAEGRRWDLDEIRGHVLRGLDLRDAEWAGVYLDAATFIDCNFRGCDLCGASLRGTRFERCRMEGARLDGAMVAGDGFYGRLPFGYIVDFGRCDTVIVRDHR